MKVLIGNQGLKKSQQDPFPEVTECHNCDGRAVVAFVAYEGDKDDGDKFLCDTREAGGPGNIWPHDLTAFAVYICPKCGEATTIWNQG